MNKKYKIIIIMTYIIMFALFVDAFLQFNIKIWYTPGNNNVLMKEMLLCEIEFILATLIFYILLFIRAKHCDLIGLKGQIPERFPLDKYFKISSIISFSFVFAFWVGNFIHHIKKPYLNEFGYITYIIVGTLFIIMMINLAVILLLSFYLAYKTARKKAKFLN